jgi:hypothetical protein
MALALLFEHYTSGCCIDDAAVLGQQQVECIASVVDDVLLFGGQALLTVSMNNQSCPLFAFKSLLHHCTEIAAASTDEARLAHACHDSPKYALCHFHN